MDVLVLVLYELSFFFVSDRTIVIPTMERDRKRLVVVASWWWLQAVTA